MVAVLKAMLAGAAVILAAAEIALAAADTPEVLRVSAIPDENPTELLRIYTPVAEYLLVWYGGFTSVQAERRTDGTARRLALRQEDAEFTSVFVARPSTASR